MNKHTAIEIGVVLATITIVVIIMIVTILGVGASPLKVLKTMIQGSGINPDFSINIRQFSNVVNYWIYLTPVSIGLVIAFRANLWNIGVEGQIVAGAILASFIALEVFLPPIILVPLEIFAAMIGGALWAMLVGYLKTKGVHEIFGGIALYFLASIIAIWLISGPWEPPEGGSAQSTAPFQKAALLHPVNTQFNVSLVAFGLVFVGIAVAVFLLSRTYWGLKLKAVGLNARSAQILGVKVNRSIILSMGACGLYAGTVGAFRVLFTYDSLRPMIGGGIGFTGLLVVLLAGKRIMVVPVISLLFSLMMAGGSQMKIVLQLDQSLVRVIQGTLVLTVVLSGGVRDYLKRRRYERDH